MAFDVHDCIAFLTNQGGKLLDEAMNKQFKDQEITRTQWTALYYIDRINDITQKELADAMKISEPSTTNLVNRLEAADFVQRINNSDNARVKILKLTELGAEKLVNLAHIPIEFNEKATKDISAEDLNTFKRVMRKMIERVSDDVLY